ncbi:Cof-type HAD-IIB family hydrolase [uncultured Metabacillus sp.]|uniref:Cof-type HAD-IIB family hydrolase n=1 Tax=Metabacillus sp. Hm71 TaxID=3450743 RepID=UPI0026050802|nr:Cof-type HAD-IIB family hydrolase [uncultured Metabacillus sp.]
MSEKVIFFDIDGTILDHNKEIPKTTRETIQKLKSEGHHVAIATGRAPFMFEDLRKELNIHSFVSFNGQYVVFEGEVIYENPIKKETLENLLQFADKENHPLVFMSAENMMSTTGEHPLIEESMGSLKFTQPEKNRNYYLERNIYQTLLFCEIGEEERYTKQYSELKLIRWHDVSTDILPANGSKAEGIKQLAKRLNIPRENIYAFGDGLNDLEMIEFVGTGVAMGNAVPSLKEIADFITKPVDEDGIQFGCEQLGLLK